MHAIFPQPVSPVDPALERRWDIFCRLVDNMGDIGVCWRLARVLALYHGRRVRLWVDDVEAFWRLCPDADRESDPVVFDGVEVRRWLEPFPSTDCADVVIEAFACDPPAAYVETMASRSPSPLWINLEYLTAESWIDGIHGMASPHPRLPLTKRFFFPGFSPASGGLLREPGLLAERDRFVADRTGAEAFLNGLVCDLGKQETLRVSLFSYEQPRLPELMSVWASGDRPIQLIVPEGRVTADVARFFGRNSFAAGEQASSGALSISVVPFMSQRDYDRLLWCCDLNFVRGEDSFVRAQWAVRPFVWHIYAQDENAHRVKLEAFLARYLAGVGDSLAGPVRDFWLAWNGYGDIASSWPAFVSTMSALSDHAKAWADGLAASEDLVSGLVKFDEVSVK